MKSFAIFCTALLFALSWEESELKVFIERLQTLGFNFVRPSDYPDLPRPQEHPKPRAGLPTEEHSTKAPVR